MHPAHGSDRPRTIWPPDQVRTVTALHVDLVDEALPWLVEGLYLHGSLGFGEWYDGRSDVDFVAVTAERPDEATAAVLREGTTGSVRRSRGRRTTGSTSPGPTSHSRPPRAPTSHARWPASGGPVASTSTR